VFSVFRYDEISVTAKRGGNELLIISILAQALISGGSRLECLCKYQFQQLFAFARRQIVVEEMDDPEVFIKDLVRDDQFEFSIPKRPDNLRSPAVRIEQSRK